MELSDELVTCQTNVRCSFAQEVCTVQRDQTSIGSGPAVYLRSYIDRDEFVIGALSSSRLIVHLHGCWVE